MPSACPRMLHIQYGGASDERPSPPSRWKAARISIGAGPHQPACRRDRLRISGALCGGILIEAHPPSNRSRPSRDDLLRLADWLVACGVTSVAMEATGVYGTRYTKTKKPAASKFCSSSETHQERHGAKERCVRLRMVTRTAYRRLAEWEFPYHRSHRRVASVCSPSAERRGERRHLRPADAEGAGADEASSCRSW